MLEHYLKVPSQLPREINLNDNMPIRGDNIITLYCLLIIGLALSVGARKFEALFKSVAGNVMKLSV